MKIAAAPAKFSVMVRSVKIDGQSNPQFRLCLKRKGKTINSKVHRKTGQYTNVNELLQFPTTLQRAQNGNYSSKKVTLELQIKQATEPAMQSMSVELELTFFIESKQFSLLLCNEKMSSEVKIEGLVQTEGFNPSSSILSQRSSELISERDAQQVRQDSKSAFGPAKKQKTWLKKNDQDTKSVDANYAAPQKLPKTKSQYAIAQPPCQVRPVNQAQPRIWDKYSVNTENDVKQKRRVNFQEQQNVAHQMSQRAESAASGKIRQTKSDADGLMQDEVHQLRKSNRLLKKEMDEMRSRLSECQIKENNKASLQQSVITRLKEEVASKNRIITNLEQQIEEVEKQKRNFEDDNVKLQRQITELISMKEKNQSLSSYGKETGSHGEVQKMQKQYQQQIADLKKKLSDFKRQLLFKDLQNASIPANMINTQICLSKECDNERKQLKSSVKSLKKSLQEAESKIKTKQKLLQTYKQIQEDRERDKQNDKWKAEKAFLEQQVANLREQIKQQPVRESRKKDTQEKTEYVRRSQKEALQKQLQKLKKALYQTGQEHDSEQKQLKDQLMKIKLLTMNLLNAAHEYGGRILYDKISDASFCI